MRLEDALFNWMQIKWVANARKEDNAAVNTVVFFEEILQEDHGLTDIILSAQDDNNIVVRYKKDGLDHEQVYPRELGEQLLKDIIANPKYN